MSKTQGLEELLVKIDAALAATASCAASLTATVEELQQLRKDSKKLLAATKRIK